MPEISRQGIACTGVQCMQAAERPSPPYTVMIACMPQQQIELEGQVAGMHGRVLETF
jgi:hypothetical protein